jgi:hypothetical protein
MLLTRVRLIGEHNILFLEGKKKVPAAEQLVSYDACEPSVTTCVALEKFWYMLEAPLICVLIRDAGTI